MERLRVATWNLERMRRPAGVRHSRQLEWMRRVDADIWVLTETHRDVEIDRSFRSVVAEPADDLGEGESWVGVWSRFPVEPMSRSDDPARSVGARVNVPGVGPVVVAGTVLPWRGRTWRGLPSAGGDAFRAALAVHAADWRRWREAVPGAPVIVAGDFNQDLSSFRYYWSESLKAHLRQELRDAELVCLTEGEEDPISRGTGGHRASIDHVCVSSDGQLTKAGGPWTWPFSRDPLKSVSDHFGVVVELRFGALM